MELIKFVAKDQKKKEKLNFQIARLQDQGYPQAYINEALEMRKTICKDWSLKEIVSCWDRLDTRVSTFNSYKEFIV